ncbi:MAG: DUF3151 domain-containing protein [Actinomycetota bacterium]|nr:DUF3151 domain-containing protein [Actinomycetota bacterium]
MAFENLLGGTPETRLPDDPAAALLDAGEPLDSVVRRHPESSLVWAALAERALADGREVDAYAYARTGYHRGLDALRRNGWKGHGPVPWSHEPNRGFLRAVAALAEAARRFGESAEERRCADLLQESSPEAAERLRG